jgi:YD repeat-containing protein
MFADGWLSCQILVLLTLVFVADSYAHAQQQGAIAQGGTSTYSSYQPGGIDTVNLVNGNVAVKIPLFSYPQPGNKLRFGFSLVYNVPQWYYDVAVKTLNNSTAETVYVGDWHNQDPQAILPIGMTVVRDQSLTEHIESLTYPCNAPSGFCDNNNQTSSTTANLISITTDDGATHNIGLFSNGGPTGFELIPSFDGSNFVPIPAPDVASTIGFGAFTSILGPDGIRYTPLTPNTNVSTFNSADPDGNTITVSSTGWADSVGHQVPGSMTGPGAGGAPVPGGSVTGEPLPGVETSDLSPCTAGAVAARTWIVPGPNSGESTYTLCYRDFNIATSFPSWDNGTSFRTDQQGSGTARLLTQVVLPNKTSYTFNYDSYLELTTLILPTGGNISYQWQPIQWGGLCDIPHQQSRAILTRTANDLLGNVSTWNYKITPVVGGCGGNTTVITDPQGNDEVHTGVGSQIAETIQYYQGAQSSGNLLKTVVNTRSGIRIPFDFPSGGSQSISGPLFSTTTTWAKTGATSKVSYQQVPSTGDIDMPQFGINSNVSSFPVITCSGCLNTHQIASVQEFDYGNGAPGPLLRTTTTQYQWQKQPSSPYLADNLINLPDQITIIDGSGAQVAQTTYGYDENNGSPQGVFGHLTSTTRWNNAGSSPVSQTVYNSQGMPTVLIDANNNKTSISEYQCSGVLPKTVIRPFQSATTIAETTTYVYDCNTGKVTSIKDPNNQTTTYTYLDSLGRLTVANYPDGGAVSWSYDDNPALPKMTVTTATGEASGLIVETAVYDGFGRTVQAQQNSDPVAPDFIDIKYDSLGRVGSISNPFRGTQDASFGITSYGYDALGRKTLQTQPDGSTLHWNYVGNAVDFRDETTRHWQRTTDALGRLTQVLEPDSANNPTIETDYQYDGSDNLTRVDQWGGPKGSSGDRIRTFSYDSLSRLIASSNPETGASNYSYDLNGNLKSKTSPAPNSPVTSGITITTNYQYDALNRITNKSSAGVSGIVAGFNYTYGYDSISPPVPNGIGHLLFTTDNISVAELYSYDAMGRMTSQSSFLPSAPHTADTISATYDLAGKVSSISYPNGQVIHQMWNRAGELSQVTDANSGYQYLTSQSSYWPNGTPSGIWHGNGVADGYHLNSRLQIQGVGPTRIGTTAPGSDSSNYTFASRVYCYGPATPALAPTFPGCPSQNSANNGNILGIIDALNGNNSQAFAYDNLNRISAFTNGSGSMQQTFGIDPWGNMTQSGSLTFNVSYAGSSTNQITSPGFIYDAAGDLTSFNNGVFTNTFAYDAESKLINVNNDGAVYTYDVMGNRIRKALGNDFTEYVQFGGQTLAEKASDGSWTNYIYANGQRLARVESSDIRIHMSGVNCSDCGSNPNMFAGTTSLTAANNYIIRPGDKLAWRQFQDGSALQGNRTWKKVEPSGALTRRSVEVGS